MKHIPLFFVPVVAVIICVGVSGLAPVAAEAFTRPTIGFRQDLGVGSKSEDVRALQVFLNANGYVVSDKGVGSAGYESDYFGVKTQNALSMFQLRAVMSSNSSALLLELGRLSPVTRAYINSNGQLTRTEVRRRGKPSSSAPVSAPEVVVTPPSTFPQMRVSWALSTLDNGSIFDSYDEVANYNTISSSFPQRRFSIKIENIGEADLTMVGEGLSFISETGLSTSSSPVFPVAPSASTTFVVTRQLLCNQAAVATSTISTNDPSEPEFELVLESVYYACS
jgi:hypothetical protein